MAEEDLSLAEFVALPDTVEFNVLNMDQFNEFSQQDVHIKFGTELDSGYIAAYTNKKNIQRLFEAGGSDFIGFYPKIVSPLGERSNNAAGVTPVLEHPYLNLSGAGVIIGIVDTGIDYTKDVFRHPDGRSKILGLWDQSLEGARGEDLYYGAEFSHEDLNRALATEDPFSVVPSRDTDGHGTFLASVAAGRVTEDYTGAAPGAELVVVKLKRAREFYIDKYLLPKDAPNLYSSTDLFLGVRYIFSRAEARNMPVVLCLGMGSNMSGHDGNTPSEDYLSLMTQRIGIATVAAGGNESNAKHHTQGRIAKTGGTDVMALRVGEESTSFTLCIFAASYERISVGISSPAGEVISRVPFKVGLELETELTLDKTRVSIGYYKDVNTVIILGFEGAKEGIWEINLYGESILGGDYYAWLPITGQVSPLVEFMRPVPEYTVVFPSTSLRTMTCGSFSARNGSLCTSSSWGPTRLPRMAPDFVAPGVNVEGIYPDGPGTMTGTSVAAAVTAGATALLFEWGLVQENMRAMDGDTARLMLISGCRREEGLAYPNTRWGFGRLDLYGTFLKMKETGILYDESGGIV